MIKLTINSQSNPIARIFDQKIVTIGSDSQEVDLPISSPEIQPIHIKIIEETNRFIVINVANDPFATLNDLPFGKRVIKHEDLLQIGSFKIQFEVVNGNPSHENSLEHSLNKLIEQNKLLEKTNFNSFNQDLEEDQKTEEAELSNQKKWADEELEGVNLDDLGKEMETLEDQKATPEKEELESSFLKYGIDSIISSEEKPIPNHLPIDEIELPHEPSTPFYKKQPEYQVGEFDDESEFWTIEKETNNSQKTEENSGFAIPWKFISTVVVTLLFIAGLVAGALYFNVSARNEDEELKAAEGVADIAMALKYSQVHHIKPQKKNWSDPEFIKNSLANLIPHDYPSLANIDIEGHLNNTSYSLRIYTNTDFSQFLVIAQPAPSLLQSLIPKTAIVVDSKLMQLRKVTDMKTLNRLLVNSSNLDNSNAVEVTNLVKRGELIPLNTLAQKRKGHDFTPPKTLALIRPGAENYIYNAPRYYQLGEEIMKRAINLMETHGNAFELSRLKQEMNVLSKLQNMVIYSSEGINLALQTQKAIATFISNTHFLTAYLRFNSQGAIAECQLMIDDEESHKFVQEEKPEVAAVENPNPILASVEEELPKEEVQKPQITNDEPIHPILGQLASLRAEREKVLLPVKNQIAKLIENNSKQPVEAYEKRLTSLINEYQQLDAEQKQKIANTIIHLSEEFPLIPLEDFIAYLEKAGFNHTQEIFKHTSHSIDQEEKLKVMIQKIKRSDNFSSLDEISKEASNWLKIKNFSDLKELHLAQKLIKSATLDRVNELLLSSQPKTLSFKYETEQYEALEHLLKFSGLEALEEQQYYLHEFEEFNPNSNPTVY